MARKGNQKNKDEVLGRHFDKKGRDAYKEEGAGIPGRES